MPGKALNLDKGSISPLHRNLLAAAAILTTLLIAMGGVLCVTQSIRNCPDWPGCFGKLIPPLEAGPIVEYTHRVLAALSGLSILGAAITGLIQKPRLPWIVIPPLISVFLVLEVSYFGAIVVLRGLAPGWAAVDVGSALLVVALMVISSVTAFTYVRNPTQLNRLAFTSSFSRLVVTSVLIVYFVFTTGVLIAGKGSITGCLGWPVYSPQVFQMDGNYVVKLIRLLLSVVAIALVISILFQLWRNRKDRPEITKFGRWVGFAFLLEIIFQVLLLIFGLQVYLLVPYTVIAAAFWALIVCLLARVGLEEGRAQRG
jgi:cytochrome c oxidase assembly protein subunit 15